MAKYFDCVYCTIYCILWLFFVSLISLLFYFISFHFMLLLFCGMIYNKNPYDDGNVDDVLLIVFRLQTLKHINIPTTPLSVSVYTIHAVTTADACFTLDHRFKWLTQQLYLLFAVNADNPSDSASKLCNPSGVDVSYSTRHVEESWHHLMKSEDTAKFKQIAVCNFDFLLAAVSVKHFLIFTDNIYLIS